MPVNMKLALLGGDLRQLSAARVLAQQGFCVSLWGIDAGFEAEKEAFEICENWGEAISGCSALILPLPVSGDGVRINCPLLHSPESVKLAKIVDLLPGNTPIFGGRFNPAIKKMIEEKGFRVIDYYEREEFQIKNAVPTAEGAIAFAMSQLPITIAGANIAVVGYGRIGKVLAQKLKCLDANVAVAARKNADLALIESAGMSSLPIRIRDGKNSLEKLSEGYDVIFNTVPAWVIDESVVAKFSRDAVIIDLASAPGGIDLCAAKEHGLTIHSVQSLPGKYSPKTAGEIVAKTVIHILEEGVTS